MRGDGIAQAFFQCEKHERATSNEDETASVAQPFLALDKGFSGPLAWEKALPPPPLIDVSRSFAQTEILLTGVNGFVGKVLLALLLDRYPATKRVHVLVRGRRGKSGAARFAEEVVASPVFRDADRALLERVVVHEGDASQLDAGAFAGVGLIIHCAGLVEFFPPVDESLGANVDAVERVAAVAKQVGAKLVHVSTCYVAGRADGLVEEDEPLEGFHPLRRGPDDDRFDHARELAHLRERVAAITAEGRDRAAEQSLIDLGRSRAERWGWVNTYTFSKSLGEQALAAIEGLDWAIVRPAIVESALAFPFPGWVEGGRTAAPLVLMALSGMTDWPARPDLSLEIVPVDQVAAALLSVGAALLAGEADRVYHLAGSDANPFEMRALLELLAAEAKKRGAAVNGGPKLYSGEAFLRLNRSRKRRAEKVERRLGGLARWLKSKGLPGGEWAAGRAARMRQLALQAGFREKTLDQYLPFTVGNRFVFESRNIRETSARLSEADQAKLPWTPERIDWPRYWRENQIEGILKWVQPEAVKDWSFRL